MLFIEDDEDVPAAGPTGFMIPPEKDMALVPPVVVVFLDGDDGIG